MRGRVAAGVVPRETGTRDVPSPHRGGAWLVGRVDGRAGCGTEGAAGRRGEGVGGGGVRAGLSRRARSVRGAARRVILAAAACLVLALLVAGLLVPAGIKAGKKSVQSPPQPNPQLELDRVEKEMEGIERALREQEERVEEKRKVLNTIVETKGIVYGVGMSAEGRGWRPAVKTGIDTYDFAEARREYRGCPGDFMTGCGWIYQGRKIAAGCEEAELTEGAARGSGEVTESDSRWMQAASEARAVVTVAICARRAPVSAAGGTHARRGARIGNGANRVRGDKSPGVSAAASGGCSICGRRKGGHSGAKTRRSGKRAAEELVGDAGDLNMPDPIAQTGTSERRSKEERARRRNAAADGDWGRTMLPERGSAVKRLNGSNGGQEVDRQRGTQCRCYSGGP